MFRDGTTLTAANFRIVEALLGEFRSAKAEGREVPFVRPPDLADRLGVTEQSMRTQLTRLRDAIGPLAVSLGLVLDQDSFVENRPRAGYRLNPGLRELSLADIRASTSPREGG